MAWHQITTKPDLRSVFKISLKIQLFAAQNISMVLLNLHECEEAAVYLQAA